MRININDIKIKEGRRAAAPENIEKLAESLREIGMMNPVTIDRENALAAGLRRLEAAKLLGWTDVECVVTDLRGLQAQLAEIDENLVRTPLSTVEADELLLRRKRIYEELHLETKHGGVRESGGGKMTNCQLAPVKSFAEDTAQKLGVSSRTVSRSVRRAKNMTPEAKEVIRRSGANVTRRNLDKLSRLEPERQKEAAEKLAAGEIKSVDECNRNQTKKEPLNRRWADDLMAAFCNPMKELVYRVDSFQSHMNGFAGTLTRKEFGDLAKMAKKTRLAPDKFLELLDSDALRDAIARHEPES